MKRAEDGAICAEVVGLLSDGDGIRVELGDLSCRQLSSRCLWSVSAIRTMCNVELTSRIRAE